MAGSTQSNILLSAADVSWGTRECYEITVNDAAADLGGEYFTIEAPGSDFGASVGYYVWFDLDAGSVDPAPGGTGIEVDVVTGDTAAQVAGKVQAVLEAHASFRSTVSGAAFVAEAEFKGPVDNVATAGTSAVTISQNRVGLGGDLGRTSGGVEVTMEAQSVQITADQTGALVLDEVFTGSSVSASMSLLEMTAERWKTIVGSVTGDAYTPSGGTEVVGYGESRLYQSFFDLGGELVLHPTRKAASDKSFDITLFKCAPKPASINFSGEEPQVMEVEFVALADRSIQSAVNLMAFGDSSQDLRA